MCGLTNERNNGGESSLFFLVLVQVPAKRCEQGKVGEVLRSWFEVYMRPSFQVEQRSPLVANPCPNIAPEAGTLPPVLAPISKEEGGLAAHPTLDGGQFCLCVERQSGNGLADAFALNHPVAVHGLCMNTRCERSFPVEAGEQFLACTQFV